MHRLFTTTHEQKRSDNAYRMMRRQDQKSEDRREQERKEAVRRMARRRVEMSEEERERERQEAVRRMARKRYEMLSVCCFDRYFDRYSLATQQFSADTGKMVDVSQYKVGIVLSLEGCGCKDVSGKALKACKVNVTGDETNPLTIVTSASNVRKGSRVVVALAGTSFLNSEGEELTLKKTIVGEVISDGMFCDSRMLGWSGGECGVPVQLPHSYDIGSAPPSSKPRPKEEEPTPDVQVKGRKGTRRHGMQRPSIGFQ